MQTLTRDDTDHNTEYVTKQEAMAEIEAMERQRDHWKTQAQEQYIDNSNVRAVVAALVRAKGRFHTEHAYNRLVAAFEKYPIRPLVPPTSP